VRGGTVTHLCVSIAAEQNRRERSVEYAQMRGLQSGLDVEQDFDEPTTGSGGGVDTAFYKTVGAHACGRRPFVTVRHDPFGCGAEVRRHASFSVALGASDTIAFVLDRCKRTFVFARLSNNCATRTFRFHAVAQTFLESAVSACVSMVCKAKISLSTSSARRHFLPLSILHFLLKRHVYCRSERTCV
jgi:hypothetical protein